MESQASFREVTGTFATGVTVVTVGLEEIDHGMTVNSFASVSLTPPLVLFCADTETTTHDLVDQAGHYAVNILTAEQEWISTRFAGDHHEMDDPFEDITVTRAATGAPIIGNTLGYLDCTLFDAHDAGDHTIYVGSVEHLAIRDPEANPLLFHRGTYDTID